MTFPRYPRYRGSGVEWLGQVPGHWHVLPLKSVATCNDEVLPEGTASDTGIEYVEISGVEEGRGIVQTEAMTFGAAPSRARRVVRHGERRSNRPRDRGPIGLQTSRQDEGPREGPYFAQVVAASYLPQVFALIRSSAALACTRP